MRLATLVLIVGLTTACLPSPSPSGASGSLEIRALAGPVCPVETEPPDPACKPRPVAGARVFVAPGDGRDIVVADGTTDADGIVRLQLPPGSYIISGIEVDGLFGRPESVLADVRSGEATSVTLAYDTGIR